MLLKKSSKHSFLSKVINVVLLLIFLVGIGLVAKYGYERYQVYQAKQESANLAKDIVKKKPTKVKKVNALPAMPSEGNISIDWKKLNAINPKIKAWVYIPGTKVNYAVLQGPDNEFYLHHNEYDEYSPAGQIFMDYRQNDEFTDENTFIYGHYMYDYTKFADLNNYFNKSYFDAHNHVYIYTPTKRFVGTVFAVQSNSGVSRAHTLGFDNAKQRKEYVEYLQSRSAVKTTMKASDVKKMVTLWTCTERSTTDDDGDYVPVNKARTFLSASLQEVQ
jgi:sortase B